MTARSSDTQREALAFVAQHGGRLVRLPGGFWTYDGVAIEHRPWGDVPAEYVRTNTVKALLARGLVREAEHRTTRTTTGAPSQFAVAVELVNTGTCPACGACTCLAEHSPHRCAS